MHRNAKIALGAAGIAAALVASGHVKLPFAGAKPAAKTAQKEVPAPAVTVVRASTQELTETALVTGTLVAREEIMVGPEIEGLRIIEVLADEGDRVKKGQPLARLVNDTLEAQIAQNDAAQSRSSAAIAQAKSSITQAEARLTEAKNAFNRGKPLRQSGYLSESVLDQRESAAKTAEAQLQSARDGLAVAEAERAQVRAQRRDLDWRRARADVMAPADGIVSRRNARIGAVASAAAEPMFRIIAKGEIELDAEVTETRIARMRPGQPATIEAAGGVGAEGKVRLVSPEVDKATRLGRIRVHIGENAALRIGSFARASIVTGRSRGLVVPAAAVLYHADTAHVLVVMNDKVAMRKVGVGFSAGELAEVREGLAEGDMVVARSGTFLRDGDAVRPVFAGASKVSEVK